MNACLLWQYVVNAQMRQLHQAGSDPLSDDYYYQHWLLLQKKRFVAAQQQAHRQVRDTREQDDCTTIQH